MIRSSSDIIQPDEKGILIKTLHTQLYPCMYDFLGYRKCYDFLKYGLSIGKIIKNTSTVELNKDSKVLFWGDMNKYKFIRQSDVSAIPIMRINTENFIPCLFYDYYAIAFNILETCEMHDVTCIGIQENQLLERIICNVLDDNGIEVTHELNMQDFDVIINEEDTIVLRDNALLELVQIPYETSDVQRGRNGNIFSNIYWNEINALLKKMNPFEYITAHVHDENLQQYLQTYNKEALRQKSLVMDW